MPMTLLKIPAAFRKQKNEYLVSYTSWKKPKLPPKLIFLYFWSCFWRMALKTCFHFNVFKIFHESDSCVAMIFLIIHVRKCVICKSCRSLWQIIDLLAVCLCHLYHLGIYIMSNVSNFNVTNEWSAIIKRLFFEEHWN